MPSRSKRKGNPDVDKDGYPGPLASKRKPLTSAQQRALMSVLPDDTDPDELTQAEVEALLKKASERKPMTTAQRRALMSVLPDDVDPDELTQAEIDALLKKAK